MKYNIRVKLKDYSAKDIETFGGVYIDFQIDDPDCKVGDIMEVSDKKGNKCKAVVKVRQVAT